MAPISLLSAAAATAMAVISQPASPPPVASQASTPTAEEIATQRDFYQRMTVPVTIGEHGPFRFMIDTGAQATVVTRGLTEKLGLQPAGSATLVGMASSVPVQLVELDGLRFASRTFDNIVAPMLEAQHIGADGILGLDSLQDLRVLIDFRSDTILVDEAEALGGDRGYEIVVRARRKLGRLIITSAEIDGTRTTVVIDTGAQGSVGNPALERRMRAKTRYTSRTTDVNGYEIIGNVDYARTLRMGGFQINNVVVSYADAPAFHALGLDQQPSLILGMRDLRVFDRVAIDFASRKVLFDLPRGAHRNAFGSI